MSTFFDARFSDGKTAAARDVRVALSPRGLVIRVDAGGSDLIWPYGALTTSEPLSPHAVDALVSYKHMPGASVFVPHGQFARALAKAAPHLTARAARRRAAMPWLWAAAGVAGVFALVSVSNLSPARTVAKMLPDKVRNALGEQTVRTVTDNRRLCQAADGKRAVEALSQRLSQGVTGQPKFDIVVVDWDLVNAFATPGGRIVLTKGLIKQAKSADEVAGVLAHEMGHAVLYHPETSLVRVIGMSAAVELLLGGSGGTLANLGVLLTQLSYTRQAEEEADEEALRLLEQSSISAKGLADFFRRVNKLEHAGDEGNKGKAAESSGGGLSDILRTHPPTADRVRRVEQANTYPSTPALSSNQWNALKGMCAAGPG